VSYEATTQAVRANHERRDRRNLTRPCQGDLWSQHSQSNINFKCVPPTSHMHSPTSISNAYLQVSHAQSNIFFYYVPSKSKRTIQDHQGQGLAPPYYIRVYTRPVLRPLIQRLPEKPAVALWSPWHDEPRLQTVATVRSPTRTSTAVRHAFVTNPPTHNLAVRRGAARSIVRSQSPPTVAARRGSVRHAIVPTPTPTHRPPTVAVRCGAARLGQSFVHNHPQQSRRGAVRHAIVPTPTPFDILHGLTLAGSTQKSQPLHSHHVAGST
jgi:hypothetical protein